MFNDYHHDRLCLWRSRSEGLIFMKDRHYGTKAACAAAIADVERAAAFGFSPSLVVIKLDRPLHPALDVEGPASDDRPDVEACMQALLTSLEEVAGETVKSWDYEVVVGSGAENPLLTPHSSPPHTTARLCLELTDPREVIDSRRCDSAAEAFGVLIDQLATALVCRHQLADPHLFTS